MSVESQDYKSEVLEYAVNQCIDRLLPSSGEDALSVILYQSNKVVWRVATEIYTKSGHQVDFVFIRDVLHLRIEPLQERIAEEEIIRREREAEQARIRREREAEKARIKAELEAQRLAEIAEEERIRKQKEAEEEKLRKIREAEEERIRKIEEAEELYKLQNFKEANPDIEVNSYKELESFVYNTLVAIVAEQLQIESDRVTLEASFWNDLYADELDTYELIMATEEEFDIEISEEESECVDTVERLMRLVIEKV